MIRIVIADGEELYREGLNLLLQRSRQLFIAGITSNGEGLINLVNKMQVDVVISEVQLTGMNGIDATRNIRASNKTVKIIALSRFEDDGSIIEMVEAGADGYISKRASKNELLSGIKQVVTGRLFYCDITQRCLSKMISSRKNVLRKPAGVFFNNSETEIINLICGELSSKEIAITARLAHRTVEKYRERIMQKTGARNVVGIVLYAIRNGLFSV